DLDVVVGHESSGTGHRATVLENDGNGQFLAVASLVPPPNNATTRAVLAADLDGDGDQDLIVQPSIYGQVRTRVLRNDGAFAFVDVSDDHIQGAGELWRGVAPPGNSHVLLADVDRDGDVDLAFSSSEALRIHTNLQRQLLAREAPTVG